MAISHIMFSSKTDQWATPQCFFDKLNMIHNFDIDVCAANDNAKCSKFYTQKENGLQKTWHLEKTKKGCPVCWMNPPYGRTIGQWIAKAYEESLKGCKVVCLLPARTDTRWFHDYCRKGAIIFLRGRLKFGDGKNSAPFPSMLVIFDRSKQPITAFE